MANDGYQEVVLPSVPATNPNARIKVAAVGKIFFDISDAFYLVRDCPAAVPCNGQSCEKTEDIVGIESVGQQGKEFCVKPDGSMMGCIPGERLYLMSYACMIGTCCELIPPCVCPIGGCPNPGKYLECHTF